ncbi:hypothetical protein OH77DRAFT_503126 [Trametes cingulata]|nr:hypothetical protein OH77DRAFT_503126 [Trametes cingulata]
MQVDHFPIKLFAIDEEYARLKAVLTAHPFPSAVENASQPAVLPPVPPAVRDTDHPFVLGWVHTPLWEELFRIVSMEVLLEQDPTATPEWRLFCDGFTELRARSQCGFSMFLGHAMRTDMPIWDDETSDTCWEFLPIAPLIGIACTASWFLYYRRPRAHQYEWLKTVLGSEPTWYRWPDSLELFERYGEVV